jgi:hypothetical protein
LGLNSTIVSALSAAFFITKGNKAVNKFAIDVLHDHLKNVNALDEDDDNDIVFPTNITEYRYNIELNQDITEADSLSITGF